MTVEEYAEAQAAISAALVKEVVALSKQFLAPRLSKSLWARFLRLLFPIVVKHRDKSAALGRDFYDSQRALHFPDLPPHDIFLAEYQQDWFDEAMEPVRAAFSKPGASEDSALRLALRAMKEVENGGRKTILRPIQDKDVQDDVVQGWARVATGRETCEFCLMLVSRGPVYRSARSAGLNADDETAKHVFQTGTEADLKELMTRWHEGCDCKVVPVFDKADWPGMDAAKKALDVWKKHTKLVNRDPKLRNPQNGNQRGPNDRKWSKNEAILASIRRALYSGEIKPGHYSIAA